MKKMLVGVMGLFMILSLRGMEVEIQDSATLVLMNPSYSKKIADLLVQIDPKNRLGDSQKETLRARLLELSLDQYQRVTQNVSVKRSEHKNSTELINVLVGLTDALKETNVQMQEQHKLETEKHRHAVRKWQWGVFTSIVTFLMTNGGQLVGNIWQATS